MPWKKNSPEKVQLLDDAMASLPCERRFMFGGPAYMVNDNMFAGVCQDDLFLRLSEPDRQALVDAWKGATPFEPMPGKPMREYMVLPEALYGDGQALHEWIERSLAYASSLPRKEKEAKRKKK